MDFQVGLSEQQRHAQYLTPVFEQRVSFFQRLKVRRTPRMAKADGRAALVPARSELPG